MERQKIVVYQCLLTIRVDLSEPLNGTTSGCPPPSQHHNYRRYLHTQQRNCSERCESGRFWKGVAQITRIRDRTFIASLCSIKPFRLRPFCVRDRCAGRSVRRFSPLTPLSAPNQATEATTTPQKKILEAISAVNCRFGRHIAARNRCCAAPSRQAKDSPRTAYRNRSKGVPHRG